MGAKTNHEEGIALKAAFGDAHDASHPATWHMGLLSAVVDGDTQNWTEVTGDGYARVAVANTSANWDLTNGGATDSNADGVADNAIVPNAVDIEFAAMTAEKTAVAVAWFDSPVAGQARFYHEFAAGVTIPAGVKARFAAGALTYQEDD